MNLCTYKNSLGEPGKGIHSYRLFGVGDCNCRRNYDNYRGLSYILFF